MKITYYFKVVIGFIKSYILLIKTLYKGECYFGPFVGEFGHLLSHIIPFVTFLHSRGVKVRYCGPSIHKPFFYDQCGIDITYTYLELRDFYSEVSPVCNNQVFPNDVKSKVDNFCIDAFNSNLPFWDIRDFFYYWDVFCKWEYFNNFISIYKHVKVNISEKSVVLFARKKGSYTPVRGDDWDFQSVVDNIKNLVDKVYVLGHPAFSYNIKSDSKVEVLLTSDNNVIIDKCKRANLIINQLSGTHYLGVYYDTPVLLLLKGKIDYSNIKKDMKYRKLLGAKHDFIFVHNINDLKLKINEISNE